MNVLRRHGGLLLVLTLLAPVLLAWSWSGQIGILGNDGPSYLMMAAHYQPGVIVDRAYTLAAVGSKYPPVYPLALALLQASELHRAHAATTIFLLLGLLALHGWLRVEQATRAEAIAIVLLFALLPGTWLTGLLIQSEFLFLLLSLSALALISHFERSRQREALLAAAIVVALASLTRTIGVTLLLPLFYSARQASPRDRLLVALFALLPFLNWHLFHRATQSYVDEIQGAYAGQGWAALQQQLSRELPALRQGFGGNFRLDGTMSWLADALGAGCLSAAIWRLRRRTPDGLYVACTLAILVVWPYPDEARRFLWVLLPVLLGQLLLATRALSQAWRLGAMGASLSRGVPAALALTMVLPAQAFLWQRHHLAAASPLSEAAHNVLWYVPNSADAERWVGMQAGMIATLVQAQAVVPSADCIIATRPDIVNYFAHRISAYPPAPATPDALFARQLRASGCHFVFSIVATDPGRRLSPLYPLPRIPDQFDARLACATPDDRYKEPQPVCLLVELRSPPEAAAGHVSFNTRTAPDRV